MKLRDLCVLLAFLDRELHQARVLQPTHRRRAALAAEGGEVEAFTCRVRRALFGALGLTQAGVRRDVRAVVVRVVEAVELHAACGAAAVDGIAHTDGHGPVRALRDGVIVILQAGFAARVQRGERAGAVGHRVGGAAGVCVPVRRRAADVGAAVVRRSSRVHSVASGYQRRHRARGRPRRSSERSSRRVGLLPRAFGPYTIGAQNFGRVVPLPLDQPVGHVRVVHAHRVGLPVQAQRFPRDVIGVALDLHTLCLRADNTFVHHGLLSRHDRRDVDPLQRVAVAQRATRPVLVDAEFVVVPGRGSPTSRTRP